MENWWQLRGPQNLRLVVLFGSTHHWSSVLSRKVLSWELLKDLIFDIFLHNFAYSYFNWETAHYNNRQWDYENWLNISYRHTMMNKKHELWPLSSNSRDKRQRNPLGWIPLSSGQFIEHTLCPLWLLGEIYWPELQFLNLKDMGVDQVQIVKWKVRWSCTAGSGGSRISEVKDRL